MTLLKDRDFPWLRLYYRTIGSFDYYINEMVEKARRDGAPADAILPRPKDGKSGEQDGKKWITSEDWLRDGLGTLGVSHLTLINAAKVNGMLPEDYISKPPEGDSK